MDLSPGLRVKRRHIRLYWSISNYLYQTIVFHQPPTSSTKRTVINSSEFANSKSQKSEKMHEIPSIQDFPDRWNMVLFHPAPVPDARLAMLQRLRSLGRPRNCAARKKPEEGWDPIAPWWFHGDECCGHLKVKFPPSQPKNPSYGWNGRCRSTSSKGTLLCSPRNKTCKELHGITVNQLTGDDWYDHPGSHSEKQAPTVSMKHCLEPER